MKVIPMQKMLLISLITLALITPLQSMSMQHGGAAAAAAQCLGAQCKKKPKMGCRLCKEILYCCSKCKRNAARTHAETCSKNENAGAAAAAKESADKVEADTDGTISIADALKLSQESFNELSLEEHVALTQSADITNPNHRKLLGMLAKLPHEREAAIRQQIAQEIGFESLGSAMSALLRSFGVATASASPTE